MNWPALAAFAHLVHRTWSALRQSGILPAFTHYREINMGQAKLRGNKEQRVAQAVAKIEATRPEKLVCNGCSADVTSIHPVSTRGLRGIESLWVGQCECGQTTFAASGEPQAVQAFFDALSEDTELTLGSQSKDGSQHDKADLA